MWLDTACDSRFLDSVEKDTDCICSRLCYQYKSDPSELSFFATHETLMRQ